MQFDVKYFTNLAEDMVVADFYSFGIFTLNNILIFKHILPPGTLHRFEQGPLMITRSILFLKNLLIAQSLNLIF